ncbi:hypothetical protein FHW69_001628 [Luteibacter sp. Sphag1AF]|uniref:hypothetical protein n=1 Tax=Luteibacter sp. Sphag1AF TaxID=2587031 RepID=UPI001614AE7C|nr:hypothetical protein [Luteibacter sp. Sphag1AF]MBB3227027.1 hypothetical protein [Luteibacter sp. Sphag1AF]
MPEIICHLSDEQMTELRKAAERRGMTPEAFASLATEAAVQSKYRFESTGGLVVPIEGLKRSQKVPLQS